MSTLLKAPKMKMPAEYEKEAEQKSGMDRRRFMNYTGWLAVLGSIAISLLGFLRFLFPRVLFEPSKSFKGGLPSDFQSGTVSTKFVATQRVWIIREEDHFFVLSAICTHLGCTPKWFASEDKFKCPCHGSGFRRSGINFEGPAPRPLERFKVVLAEDGQLLIDKGRVFRQEKDEWDLPDSKLFV